MDFCDKCGEKIDKLEPCLRIEYGFNCDDNSFAAMGYLLVHVDCLSDVEALTKVLESFEKN